MLPYRHKKVTFQLSNSHIELLKRKAKKNNKSFSDELRYAIYSYLKRSLAKDIKKGS